MLNRRFTVIVTTMVATLLLASFALAQGTKKYAVMPFEYNGPQKYAYFPKAFQASLNNDLEWAGHVEPASDTVVEGIKAPKGQGEAINTLRSTGLDYLVSGSITILGKEATLTMKALGVDGNSWERKGQMGIDEITPWLDGQSKAIMGDVFNRPGYASAEQVDKKEASTPLKKAGPTNAQFIQAENDQFQAATLNPQFRYEGGTENTGRWRSQTFRFSSTSMVVADGDGDGQNEVFILNNTGISAFRFKDGKLQLLESIKLTPSTKYIRLEAADVTKDGIPELIVGSYQVYYRNQLKAPEGTVKSYIFSFEGGKFKQLVSNYRKFLGVLRTPPTYTPTLVTQAKGQRHLFEKHIYEAHYKDGKIITGQRIATPEYGNIYNMIYLPDELGYKYIVLDDFHRLKVYDQTLEKLSSSDEDRYNSSGVGIDTSERPLGMGPGMGDDKINTYNIPFRMIAASLSKKGKYELLVNKDLSIAAQFFQRFTYFSQGEIHALAWDGVGMNLAWKTRRIKGQVADIGLADINNDGKKQLVVLLNTFPGGMGFTNRKTIVLAYDLNL